MYKPRKKKKNKSDYEKLTSNKLYAEMIKNGSTEPICQSQVNVKIYETLSSNNKLGDFLACVKYCSSKQYTKELLCEEVNKAFRFYVDDGLTVGLFDKMLEIYKDVADSWGYGTLGTFIDLQKVKNKALKTIVDMPTKGGDKYDPSKNLKAIETYHKLYDKEYQDSLNDTNTKGSLNVSIDFGDNDGGKYE